MRLAVVKLFSTLPDIVPRAWSCPGCRVHPQSHNLFSILLDQDTTVDYHVREVLDPGFVYALKYCIQEVKPNQMIGDDACLRQAAYRLMPRIKKGHCVPIANVPVRLVNSRSCGLSISNPILD